MSEMISCTLRCWPWPEVVPEEILVELDVAGIDLAHRYAVDLYEAGEEPHRTPCRTLQVIDQFNYGSIRITDDSNLLERLRAWNIAFVLQQDPKYEFGGSIIWWHPGMLDAVEEDAFEDGGLALSPSRFIEMAKAAEAQTLVLRDETKAEHELLGVDFKVKRQRSRLIGEQVEAFFARTPWSWSPVAPAVSEEVVA